MSGQHSFAGFINFENGFTKDSAGKEGGDDKDNALQFSDINGPPTKSKTRTSPRRKNVIMGISDDNDDDDNEIFVYVQGEKRLAALRTGESPNIVGN